MPLKSLLQKYHKAPNRTGRGTGLAGAFCGLAGTTLALTPAERMGGPRWGAVIYSGVGYRVASAMAASLARERLAISDRVPFG